MYSTEHLQSLGRIEKRTIYLNDLPLFFGNNEIVLDKVMTAAGQTTADVPFVPVYLSHTDRWHIMSICLNRISAMFGPFHIFFNEARRCKSYYRSAWYLFTISYCQNQHRGRFFVTPYKPVLSKVDVGVKRLRVDLVNEQEMRDICTGAMVPPDWGFFNNRHKYRWEVLCKMSELFENQLVIINDDQQPVHPSSPGVSRGTSLDIPSHLQATFDSVAMPATDDAQCEHVSSDSSESEDEEVHSPTSWQSVGNVRKKISCQTERSTSNPRKLAKEASRIARMHEGKEIDNCIMRVHIPYPSSMVDPSPCETHAKDVVLFE